MKFKVGDRFKIWFIDNIAYIHIASYRNGGKWTPEEFKEAIYKEMYEEEFEVVEVKPFKVKLKYWEIFHKVEDWFSKRQINKWIKHNYSKDSLWEQIVKEANLTTEYTSCYFELKNHEWLLFSPQYKPPMKSTRMYYTKNLLNPILSTQSKLQLKIHTEILWRICLQSL